MEYNLNIHKRGILKTWIIGSVPSFTALDTICKDKKEVFIFVDFNNMIKGLYYPQMIELILNYINTNNGNFPSILINEWVALQNYLESYAESRSITKFHTIYFSEGGQSYYHKNLHKDYKKHRKNALFSLPPSLVSNFNSYETINELIRGFLVSSWKWIELLSKEFNILSIRLENLDADFIPELLLRQFNIYKDDAVYIILSSDGDMVQTLDIADNIYIYDGNTIISDQNWLNSKKYLEPTVKKKNNTTNKDNDDEIDAPIILNENKIRDITPDKIILFKAIVGDTSDDIPGLKGIGIKTFFNKFIELIPNNIRADDLENVEKICFERRADNKVCGRITDNYEEFKKMIKLVSFKMLIQWLQTNKPRYDQIKKIIDDNYSALVDSCKLRQIRNSNNNKK